MFPTGGRYIGRIQRDEGDVRALRDWGGEESTRQTARNCFYPIYVKNEEIVGFGEVCSDDFHPGASNIHNEDGTTSVYPIDSHGVERKWRYARQSVERIRDDLLVEEIQGETIIRMRKSIYRYKTVWTDRKYNSNAYGSRLLSNMFGEDMSKKVSFPKSIHNVKDCIDATTQNTENATIADYFAGSGTTAHAVINLNREDAGSRKFLLVEMEEYFDTVMLPRIKKATYAPEWQEGKPKRAVTTEEAERSPRIVKYIRLESYEDALNNITFSDAPKTLYDFDDYLLKYMLAWGTRESETLLSVGKLASPFSYKLTITGGEEVREEQVDIPETFAYLLGLNVKTRGVFQDGDRYYLVYRGSIDHREIAVIWRETAGWEKRDYERDKDFVEEQGLTEDADEVFVNGDSCIPKARALESVFKSRMFGSL